MGREKIIPLLQSGLGIDETARKAGVTAREIISVQSFYSEFAGLQDGEIEEALSYQGSVSDMFAPADYDRIGKLCEKPDEILNSIKDAGIKGRGGGGFPVASKWQFTKNAAGENKYIVCNGSEGEGHTCKDLALMLRAPHAIIQGMMLCAAAVGAKKGYIHVRSEYHEAARCLEKAVAEAKGKLGAFEIEVFRGGGSYVCGEETALLRMLQGYRGEPALRPPYPGEKGIYGCPTVVNNVESFAAVSCYALTGKIQKLYTVTGCVDRPGVYEFSADITVRQLAEAAGMCGAVGFQLGGGTTGRIYSIKDMDLPCTVRAIATVQEEVGTRGARALQDELVPDYALILEGPPADDTFGQSSTCRQGVLGKGVQVRLYDPTNITPPAFADFVLATAAKHNIPHQATVRRTGGTDAAASYPHWHGTPAIVFGVPTRYIHSHNGILDARDLSAAVQLTIKVLQEITEYGK